MFIVKPTKEQTAILTASNDFIPANKQVKVVALPGTGKSALLKELTYRHPEKGFLYLTRTTHNRQAALGDMPANCESYTFHAFALKHTNTKGQQVINSLTVDRIMDTLNIQLGPAVEVKKLFTEYCQSSVVELDSLQTGASMGTVARTKDLLTKMWQREIPLTQDYILKEFAIRCLTSGDLPGEHHCVLVDEFQDSSDVIISLCKGIKNKACVYVGDQNQSIFAFAGASGAIDKIKADLEFTLSVNFRSDEPVLKKANDFLVNVIGNDISIQHSPIPKQLTGKNAIITRTNAEAVEYMEIYSSFRLTKNPEELFELPMILLKWRKKEELPFKYKYLNKIKNEDELLDYIKKSNDVNLGSAYNLIRKKGEEKILKLFKKAIMSNSAESVNYIMTAHASKGLEFDNVRIGTDFPSLHDLAKQVQNGERAREELIEEANLYFVALTRAIKKTNDSSINEGMSFMQKNYIKETIKTRSKDDTKSRKNHSKSRKPSEHAS